MLYIPVRLGEETGKLTTGTLRLTSISGQSLLTCPGRLHCQHSCPSAWGALGGLDTVDTEARPWVRPASGPVGGRTYFCGLQEVVFCQPYSYSNGGAVAIMDPVSGGSPRRNCSRATCLKTSSAKSSQRLIPSRTGCT